MSYIVKVIFDKEQIIKLYNDAPLSEEEMKFFVNEYEFNSSQEKHTFIKGLNEAVR